MAQKESVCGPENGLMCWFLVRGGGSEEEEQRTAIEGASSYRIAVKSLKQGSVHHHPVNVSFH